MKFIFLFLLLLLTGACGALNESSSAKKPNILFICTDDQGAWALGASGNKQAITPHMDRLVGDGAYLVNSFVTTGVCSPSRAATLTSQYGYEVGVDNWFAGNDFEGGLDLDSVNFVEVLQQSGYHTALIGKWHLGMHDKYYPTKQGFDYFLGHRHGGFKTDNPTLERNGKKIDFQGLTADILADDVISFMENHINDKKDQPFYLAWHTRAPHTKWLPVSEDDAKPYGKAFDPVLPDPDYPNLDVKRVKKMMTEYLSSTRSVDRNLGRVMGALKKLGIEENTIVVFTSDHGYNVGHNGIWHKGNGYHTLTKNPVDTPAVAKNMKSYMRPNAFDTSIRVPTFIR